MLGSLPSGNVRPVLMFRRSRCADVREPGGPRHGFNASHQRLRACSRRENLWCLDISNSREHRHAHHRQLPLRWNRIRNRGRDSRKADTLHVLVLRQARTLCAYDTPSQFKLTKSASRTAAYRWNSKLVAHHSCPTCGRATFSDSPAFQPDGKWDGETRSYAINARLFDNCDAAEAPVTGIDGRNPW
jgi:hypothetical protein